MHKSWFDSYEPGVPKTINPDAYPSVNALLAESFRKFKDLPVVANMGNALTFAELDQQSRNFAAFLQQEIGLVKGDRVAIFMPNLLQYAPVIIGIIRAGGIAVSINFLFDAEQLEHQLNDSQATVLIVSENLAHLAANTRANTTVKHIIVVNISDIYQQPKALLVDLYLKYVKRIIPKWHLQPYYKYKDALIKGAHLAYVEPQIRNTDIALLQYTGGTTGTPKGAILTHRNVIADILQLSAVLKNYFTEGKDIAIQPFPFFHIAAIINLLLFMRHGGLNVLITNPRDVKSFIKTLKQYKFTFIIGVNGIYNLLLNDPEIEKVDFSNFKFAIASGMAIQKSVAMRWKHLTKKTIIEGYGLTEAALGVCCNPFTIKEINGTVGIPLPSTEISIRNDHGEEFGIDQPGEIWIRGPQIMTGYWHSVEETHNALTEDGWFKTGDVGMINEQGFLTLIDRKKDTIFVLGFHVYPSEVEQVISMMPEVREVAVFDAFDEVYGEIVKAAIVPSDPNLTVDQVLAFCRLHLVYYKIPTVIEFRKELPKSAVGKVLRRALRYGG